MTRPYNRWWRSGWTRGARKQWYLVLLVILVVSGCKSTFRLEINYLTNFRQNCVKKWNLAQKVQKLNFWPKIGPNFFFPIFIPNPFLTQNVENDHFSSFFVQKWASKFFLVKNWQKIVLDNFLTKPIFGQLNVSKRFLA